MNLLPEDKKILVMRRWIFVLGLAAACSFNACQQKEPVSSPRSEEDGVYMVTISLLNSGTKATSITTPFEADSRFKCLDVFVLDAVTDNPSASPVVYRPGLVLNHHKFTPTAPADVLDISHPIKFASSRGRKFFFVVANDSRNFDAISISDYDDICGLLYDMSNDSQHMWSPGNNTSRNKGLLITGLTEYNLASRENVVPVSLQRQCSRLNIARITNNLPAIYGALTVKAAFLTNYIDKWPLGGTSYVSGTPSYCDKWGLTTIVNPATGLEESGYLIDGDNYFGHNGMASISQSVVIPNGASSTDYAAKGLYCFANPNQSASWWYNQPSTWPNPSVLPTTWPTRLVLSVTLAGFPGRVFYYAMTPSEPLKPNSTYDITVAITNLGTSSPESPLESGTAHVTVTSAPWTVVDDTFVQ